MKKCIVIRLYPTDITRDFMKTTIDDSRFVFNWALEKLKEFHANGQKWPSKFTMQLLLTELKEKEGYEWLSRSDSQALNNAITDLYAALNLWKKGVVKFPSFKKRKDGYRTRGDKKQDRDGYINLRKIGYVKYRGIDKLPGHILNVTVKNRAGKYYATLCYDDGLDPIQKEQNLVAGIDIGVKTTATVVGSDGYVAKYNTRRPTLKEEKRRARYDRRMSRETRGSNNWRKNLIKLQNQYRREANRRDDDLKKMVKKITDRYDKVIIEDTLPSQWKIKGNPTYNKNIKYAGCSKFIIDLKNKAESTGTVVQKADKFFKSSQICSCCGHIEPKVKSNILRKWTCKNCGAVHDRDINAATNLMQYQA